jgi:hypothetical protein
MTWLQSLWFLFGVFLIVLLLMPIFIEVRLSYNPLENRGVIALFLFGKKVVYYFVALKGKAIEFRNEGQTMRKEIAFSGPEMEVLKELGREIKEKIRVKKCFVFYNIGLGDAATSAYVCGLVNQAINWFFVVLKNQKPTATLGLFDTVSYNIVQCEIASKMQVSISLFDVVYSYLHSVIITKKAKKIYKE